MSEFLVATAGFVLLTVVVGLWRILRGPDDVDRTLATQLLGTGGIAVLLLVAAGTGAGGAEDLALGLALLAAFASVAFVTGLDASDGDGPGVP
jgi:multicomponent Na+:H+ antiporter subunit F